MATAEELKILLTADNKASASVNKLRNDVTNLGKDAQKSSVMLATANGNMTKSFAGLGRNAGMAGIQIQQFVGQVQGGVNPMVALSQQGADLGFVLGVPLVGAIVGIGSAIAMTLIPSLDEAEVKFKDLKNSLSGLTDDFKNMSDEMRAASIAVLVGKLTEETLEYNKAVKAREEAEKKVAIAQSDLANSKAYATIKDASDTLLKYNTELNTLVAQEAIANGQRQETQAVLDRVVGVTANLTDEQQKLSDSYDDLKEKLVDQVNTFGMTSTEIERYNILTSDYSEKQRAALLNLLDHIEAQKQQAEAFKNQKNEIRGVTGGIEAYAATIKNADIETGAAAMRGMRTLEDSLVDITTGTKSAADAFKDMARSIIADIMRIQIRQALLSSIGGINLFGGGTPTNANWVNPDTGMTLAGQRANGGSVTGGNPYLVGEKGAEIFVPNGNGTIIPNDKLGGGSGQVVNQTINVTTGVSQTVRAEIANLMPQIIRAAQSATADARMRGGAYSSAMGA
jgi:hypothetical protein